MSASCMSCWAPLFIMLALYSLCSPPGGGHGQLRDPGPRPAIAGPRLLRPPAVPQRGGGPAGRPAEGTAQPVGPEAVPPGALADRHLPLRLPGPRRALHLPLAALLARHLPPLLPAAPPPAHRGVAPRLHHRPPGTGRCYLETPDINRLEPRCVTRTSSLSPTRTHCAEIL